jgi:hydrogenase maturation protein HypF
LVPTRVDAIARRDIRVHGLVQGVGFRPFVHRLASRHGLAGFVRNVTGGVRIEAEGPAKALEDFLLDLRSGPPNARIDRISVEDAPPTGVGAFTIEASRADSSSPTLTPDLATCPDCLRELCDPADRRRGYAFTTCTNCGPRLTVIESAPYDRERTTMAPFPLCAPCRAEYEDPGNRRHHAESTACPVCGPRLSIAVEEAARRLLAGGILAVKGLGGYHLACDATNDAAVRELRRRKRRDEKPFAVMAADPGRFCEVSPEEDRLLRSPAAPIVLLRRRPGAAVAESVAPGNPLLGVMLPYTPLHHLLLEAAGRPLVLTSGNASDEPIAHRDGDARGRLSPIADAFLAHDREIRVRCDDSVARVLAGEPTLLRRSRGYAPAPLRLPFRCPRPTLALGGGLKSAFALGRDDEAVPSQHLGDLEHYEAWRSYVASIEHFERLFTFTPGLVVHDLHPDYPSTRYALERGLPTLAVQHHHAHMAACMAENGLEGDVIGVTFDGTGYGTDGAIWGGEFLAGGYGGFERAAHFEYVPMPGGELAIREPWRMAAAYLARAGERLPTRSHEIASRLQGPPTSSCGRLFDGVSALLGLRDRVSYEGQAAIELEWLAAKSDASGHYPLDGLRVAPIIAGVTGDLRRGVAKPDIARRFHSTVVEAIRATCRRLREERGLDRVVLSGGVFMNEIVLTGSLAALGRDGFHVFRHRLIPPNDGGLCLGQLAVASATTRWESR